MGDSAIVGDGITGALRRRLQLRYGDAGHGFLLAGKPWNWYRHRDVEHSGQGWAYQGILAPRAAPDRMFGLAFQRAHAVGVASARVSTVRGEGPGTRVSRFEVWYLAQPGGGRLSLSVDGADARTIETAAPARRAAYETIDVADGAHALDVTTTGDGAVDVFGIVLEREGPGVVVDAIGVNGAHAPAFLAGDRALLREHLARRAPDLIVLQLGTNMSTGLTTEAFGHQLRELARLVREVAPSAGCLLVAPPDRLPTRVDRPGLTSAAYVVAATPEVHRAARDARCAAWSAFDAMGGAGSYARWRVEGVAGGDGVHLGREGWDRIAMSLERALIAGVARP